MEIRQLRQDTITESEADELARLQTLVSPRRLRSDPDVTRQLAIDSLRSTGPTMAFDYWGLFDDDHLVGLAETAGALNAENEDLCETGIWIHPSRVDEGLHRVLFDHVESFERNRGRTRFWGWGTLHHEPTRAFWEDELGHELAYDGRNSRCVLADVDADLMQLWIDRAADRASTYHLVHVTSPMSDELLGYYALALDAMNDEPHDNLEFERETFDLNRAREIEALHLGVRFEVRSIFAIETATGAFAGYTGTGVPDAEPALSLQLDTATVDAHRNRGIARWMKASMWQQLRTERPDALSLDTSNAESNRAMLGINEAMNFRDITHHGVWQKPT